MEIKIYTLSSTRAENEIRYVGKTKQKLERRLAGHLCDATKHRYLKNYNHNWIRKEINDGYDILIKEIDSIEFNDDESWEWLEQYWISQFKAWGFNLTNLTDGGDGNKNQHFLKESIELRASKIRGIPRPQWVKDKISKAHKGKKNSIEHNKKVSESIIKLQGKPVSQYDMEGNFIKDWDCARDAEKYYNITYGNIGDVCRHKKGRETAAGFFWKFKGDTTIIDPYNTHNALVILDIDGNFLGKFHNMADLRKHYDISIQSISKCINKHIESVKGYKIVKYKDFMNTLSQLHGNMERN